LNIYDYKLKKSQSFWSKIVIKILIKLHYIRAILMHDEQTFNVQISHII